MVVRLDLISVRIKAEHVDALDELALRGKYAGRSEAIRVAIRDLIRELVAHEQTSYTPPANLRRDSS